MRERGEREEEISFPFMILLENLSCENIKIESEQSNLWRKNTYRHSQIVIRTKIDYTFRRTFDIDGGLLCRCNDAFIFIRSGRMDIDQLLL